MRKFINIALFVFFIKEFARLVTLLKSILLSLLFIIIGCGFLFAYIEQIDIFDALYFIFITATSVGYGDIVPITLIGKIISISAGFIGLIFIGLTVGIATVAVKETYKYHLD